MGRASPGDGGEQPSTGPSGSGRGAGGPYITAPFRNGDMTFAGQGQDASGASEGMPGQCCTSSYRPQSHHRGSALPHSGQGLRGCSLTTRWPHAAWLYRGLAIAVGLILAFHALACGAFFCFRFSMLPELSREVRDDIRDIYVLAGGPQQLRQAEGGAEQHTMIPKLIHQTYKSSNVPSQVLPLMQSWRQHNPDWDVRFYDDAACMRFVQREFPEYLDAYRALPKDVERSDFFRYMVVLRMGGMYVDMDTECKRPMSQIIQPRDTLVVGWENEFATGAEASRRQYVRKRQILQWVFAAAPGHPVLREMCDHIAQHATDRLAVQDSFDTLERTGPGMWTDLILKHAQLHTPAKWQVDPWGVRILPMVAFGAHPSASDAVQPTDPNVAVLHHFLGSWKDRGLGLLAPQALKRLAVLGWQRLWPSTGPASLHDDGQRHLYPVSVTWQPPFSILVDPAGQGELQAGDDVNALLTKFGKWQPSLHHEREPSVMEALVGSLGGKGGEGRALLDVGAGPGVFSLAAAARGHRAIAFELGTMGFSAFKASIEFNAFSHLVQLHKAALGHSDGAICTSTPHTTAYSARTSPLARGYGPPLQHAPSEQCASAAHRHVGDQFVPADVEVGAVRISAPGWEGWVVQGLQGLLTGQKPPGVILLELYPAVLEQYGYPGGAVALLQHLHDLGYTDISHSGHVCDERWRNVTRSVKLQAAVGLPPPDTLQQPTWCHLRPTRFANVAQRVPPNRPENILLVQKAVQASEAASEQDLPQGLPEKVYHGHVVLRSGEKIEVSVSGTVVDDSGWDQAESATPVRRGEQGPRRRLGSSLPPDVQLHRLSDRQHAPINGSESRRAHVLSGWSHKRLMRTAQTLREHV